MLFVASVCCCCCDVRLLTQILPAAVLPSAVTQWAVNWRVVCTEIRLVRWRGWCWCSLRSNNLQQNRQVDN